MAKYQCQDCRVDDCGHYSESYGCNLCIDCYGERCQLEEGHSQLSNEEWEEFLND